MGLGGLPVFNQHLTESLAEDHDVTLLTARSENIPHSGVKSIIGYDPPIEDGVRVAENPWLQRIASRDPRDLGLIDPRKGSYDLVIGHTRLSGPAAIKLRDNWYPNARVIYFLHTSPERLLPFKFPNDPEKVRERLRENLAIQHAAMPRADIVVGVGPLLMEEAKKLSSGGDFLPSVHELIPGTQVEPLVEYQNRNKLHLLLMGRTDDALKGVDDALQAVKYLNKAGTEVHLTIRGAHEATMKVARNNAESLAGVGNVTVKPFTQDLSELRKDIRTSDALIMPSKHEGFGLVATEATGHGIPILVNEESGVAQFLGDESRLPSDLVQSLVVQEPSDLRLRSQEWAAAIRRLKDELPQRRQLAQALREKLRAYSWTYACHALIEASTSAVVLPRKTEGTDLQQPRMTRQGPHGTLLVVDELKEIGQQKADQAPRMNCLANAANSRSVGVESGTAQRPVPRQEKTKERLPSPNSHGSEIHGRQKKGR
jgi:glycosyltransferase involved in cell wall biosynthesis